MKELLPSGHQIIRSTVKRLVRGTHDHWHDHGTLLTTDNFNPNIVITWVIKRGIVNYLYGPVSVSDADIDALQTALEFGGNYMGQAVGEYFNSTLRGMFIEEL